MALEDLSPEQNTVIEELKKRTIDCVTPRMLEDNYVFYRYAKARDFNLAEAETMLRKVMVKYVPTCFMCFDKEGHAVRYTDCGQADIPGLVNCAKNPDIYRYYAYRIEQDVEAVKKRYKKLGKEIFLSIFDLENFSHASATNMKVIQHCLPAIRTYTDNFPESLKCAFVINAPFYFVWIFAAFKHVLPATVVKKIQIYGTDGWKEELLKLIDAEVLPAFLGGNKTDPDGNPDCNTIVKRGEPIPKSYYMTNDKKKIDDSFKKLTIRPFSKEEISFEVKKANSFLEWEYEVKSRDIDFSLHFKGDTLAPVELIPKRRINTYYETEKGVFKCEKLGTYTMVLDNSYSWILLKEVYYKAAIKPPNYDETGELL